MMVGYAGLQGASIKKEKFSLSIHFTSIVQDTDGSGSDLLQYSYVELNSDLLRFLKETGRLPIATIQENFEEIKETNKLREENKDMQAQIVKLEEKYQEATAQRDTLENGLIEAELSLGNPSSNMSTVQSKTKNSPRDEEIAKLKALLETKNQQLTNTQNQLTGAQNFITGQQNQLT